MFTSTPSRRGPRFALLLTLGVASAARATESGPPELERERAFDPSRSYAHWFALLSMGKGLRFNNPYRLEHVLGSTAESLSLSATYADLGVGVAVGEPSSLQHGGVAHVSVAIEGIRQEVLTPSYLAMYRPPGAWLAGLRLGAPVILEPDLNVGFEAGLLGSWRALAGVGVYAELVYSVFYGAATRQVDRTMIPVLALQLGLWGAYEALP